MLSCVLLEHLEKHMFLWKTLEDVKEALKIAAQAAAQAAAPAAQGSGVAPTGRAPPSAAGTNVADPPARSKRGPAADSESR